ncbi:hypothetical protein [Lentzea nigeriaca]|uniref:hypothetical protein n=1 Tax=Lentzea nigeriaca TaxID=1128665 RepID=UPI00195A15AD|nr:hypothetical protein [Lentzea nigeriaca]MBM7860002.1 hypothetical protein [Lentzea nigeriaca]
MTTGRALWFIALYRRNGRLWVRDRWRRFELEPGMTAELTDVSRVRRRLTILSGGEAVWSCIYWPSLWNLVIDPGHDFTAFVDPEDHDLGLLVSNVLSQPGRIDRYHADNG